MPIFDRPVSAVSDRPAAAGAGNRRNRAEPELPAAAHRRGLRRRVRPRHPSPLRRRADAARHGRRHQVRGRASRGEPLVVFNGDVFTSVDLPAVLALHRERQAKATIVLTPVDNPSAYGLVETDADGNVHRVSREAVARSDPLRHDQRRHLRARARHARSDSPGHGLLDRARLLPVARREPRDVRRPHRTAATGSTSARRRNTARRTATSWTAGSPRRRSPAASARRSSRPTRAIDEGAIDRRAVLHRRRRDDQAGRAHRSLHRHRPSLPHRRGRGRRGRDPLAQHLGRQRGAPRPARWPAGTATSAATSRSATALFGDKSVVTDYSQT